MSEKIKPCPHCGGEADLFVTYKPAADYDVDIYIRVQCECCGASGMEILVNENPCGKEGSWDDPDCEVACAKAITAWNLRRADSEYEDLMKRVLEAIADLKTLCHPEEVKE